MEDKKHVSSNGAPSSSRANLKSWKVGAPRGASSYVGWALLPLWFWGLKNASQSLVKILCGLFRELTMPFLVPSFGLMKQCVSEFAYQQCPDIIWLPLFVLRAMRSPTAATTAVSTPPSPRGKQTPSLPPSSLSPPKATPKATSKAGASPKAKATASPKTKALSVPVPSPKAPKAAPVSPRSALAKALAPKAKPSGRDAERIPHPCDRWNAFVGCHHELKSRYLCFTWQHL